MPGTSLAARSRVRQDVDAHGPSKKLSPEGRFARGGLGALAFPVSSTGWCRRHQDFALSGF